MGIERSWSTEEISCLQDNWGRTSVSNLCAKLQRSKNAIHIKVQHLGLGPFLDSGEYLTFNQLLKAIGYGSSCSYKSISWVENRDFPVKYKRVNTNTFKVVYVDKFFKWAKENQNFIDFSRFGRYALGAEPDWVNQKRQRDIVKSTQIKTTPWTQKEDERLKFYLRQQKYGYVELQTMLHRTAGAIQRRCCDLKLKERPVKADNMISWTDEEFKILAEMIKAGSGYHEIVNKIGKSEKAIRGKVGTTYYTEVLDKVRKMIGIGSWGDGIPSPTVKQTKRKSATKGAISELLSIILYRRNDLG